MQKIMIEGRTGQDVEVKDLNGTKLAKVSLAESEKFKNKAGETQEVTTWFNLEIWGKLADIFESYVTKGTHIIVWGKMKCHKHEDKYYWSVVVSEMRMIGSKNQSSEQPKQETQYEPEPDDLPF